MSSRFAMIRLPKCSYAALRTSRTNRSASFVGEMTYLADTSG